MWHKHSSSQFQMASHKDWGVMRYDDVIVCVTVINLTSALFFIGLDQSRLTNLELIGLLIMNATIVIVFIIKLLLCYIIRCLICGLYLCLLCTANSRYSSIRSESIAVANIIVQRLTGNKITAHTKQSWFNNYFYLLHGFWLNCTGTVSWQVDRSS